MESINFKKEVNGNLEGLVNSVTEKLKLEGFGILNRIDLHSKVKEKIGKEIRPTVILGACNPELAYEAYNENPDVASLLPCNVVLRDLQNGKISVEFAKPTALMKMLDDDKLVAFAQDADHRLKSVLESI